MRFIRRCLVAASYILVFLGSAQAQSVTIGSDAVWSGGNDSANGNLLSAQIAKLSKTATVQSLSFYVTAASGNLILGIYDASGLSGGPGALKASTASFTPTKGWNTAQVVTPATLGAGSYWLAFLPSSNALGFLKMNKTGNCKYYSYSFGSLPGKFSTSPASCNPTTWSFYATLTASSSGSSAVNGACGSSNGGSLAGAPTANLCSTGTASAVSGSGPWSWSCAGSSGGTTASCSAKKVASASPVNGACGSSNGASVSTAPTANLCTAGTASTVSGSGPWSWTCAGSNGGSTASCSDTLASTGSTGTTGTTGASGSDPTSGVLPSYDDAYANWKNAGLQSVGGIPNRTTVCATVNPKGGGADDLANIQSAINNCPAGEVVQLGAGTFTISMSEYINLDRGITLRGSGTCTNSSSPYCPTVINVHDGLLAWTGGQCGTSTSSEEACATNPAIQVEPAAMVNLFDYGWSSCGHQTVASTSCGAVALAADAAQGQTTIQVSKTSSFSVGMWVLIDEASGAGWRNDPVGPNLYGQVWASSDWLSNSGSPATGRVQWAKYANGSGDFASGQYPYTAGSAGCWQSFCDRATAEIHLVKSIGSGPCPGTNCTLTFDDPLTIAFRETNSHNAYVYFPAEQNGTPLSLLQYAGVENLTIERPTGGGVNFLMCAYCWTKNVEVVGWGSGGVNFNYSVRSQMDTTFINHCGNSVNNGAEYPIGVNDAATEIYVVNSITRECGKGMVAKTAAGSVVAYSYMDDTMYDSDSGIGDYWLDMGVNGSHYAGTHEMLFEGNWGDNLDNDDTHGNQVYLTYFRNWGTALRTPFTDPSLGQTVNDASGIGYACGTTGPSGCRLNPPAPLHAVGPMMHDYWFAYVGNVLGTSGVTTAPNGWSYNGNLSTNKQIWMVGWNSDAANVAKTDPDLTAGVGPFLFRHGNYDYVDGKIADWTPGYSETLPNSFYLSSKPSFFSAGATCTYSWPWVTPTGSTPIQGAGGSGCSSYSGLPAKARFDAGTPFKQP